MVAFTRSEWLAGGFVVLSLVACGGRAGDLSNPGSSGGGGLPIHGGGASAASGSTSAGSPTSIAGGQSSGGGSTAGSSGLPGKGGAPGTAGSTGAAGGSATGGSATGGSATGGSATGGSATGGSATGGSATGGSAAGGSAAGGASGKFKTTCADFCRALVAPTCPMVGGSSACAHNCEAGLDAHSRDCATLGVNALGCLSSEVKRFDSACTAGMVSALKLCAPKIAAYQECEPDHGAADVIPAPAACTGSTERTPGTCSLTKTCPNDVSYNITCSEDVPDKSSNCVFRWNGATTTTVSLNEPVTYYYGCEDPLAAAILPLFPK